MSKVIDAIYENGVFKPLEKVDIMEHKRVKIILATEIETAEREACDLSGIVDIAKDCPDTDLSSHHDKYLYGGDTKTRN
ncbi:MAG: antitoxin family protein [Nitrospirae bacterium]|nr:antitoxin family protein [Nitrospirota bacterium]